MEQLVTDYEWLLKLTPIVIIVLGIWTIYRTRRKAKWGKVKTLCKYDSNTKREDDRLVQTGPASLLTEVTNYGPGEVTILALRGKYRDGSKNNIALRKSNIRLGVGDRLDRAIMPFDKIGGMYDGFYSENGSELVNLWFEDTYGRKHRLNGARKYLRKMRTVV